MVAGSRVGLHFLTSALRLLEPRVDDDIVDRLHYLYTAIILLMFALLVSAKQYVGHPIECFVPAQFTHAMEQYSENYCWVQNTFFIPFHEHIPHRIEEREKRQIGYYQWVPFVLSIAALMFHVPASMWRMLSNQSGLNVGLVLQTACQDQNIDPEVREKTVDILTRHIDEALQYQRDYGVKNKSVFLFSLVNIGKLYGCYVSLIYMFIKIFHLINVIVQFYALNAFLETADYPLFGGHVLYDLMRNQEWRDSGKFPRVTLCDFEIRVLGNIHRHTVQCVLVVNMFTEKIFVFLWLWFVFLATISTINISAWLATLSISVCRQNFVEKFLDTDDATAPNEVHEFVENFLRPDGVFLLKMLSMHAGNVMCARITEQLWLRHSRLYRQKLLMGSGPSRKDSNASHHSRRRTPNRERRLSRTSSHGTNQQMIVDPILPIMSQSISDTRHFV
ncbi:Innexin [Aphelenchoides bicaudatus]|nr:Innexin [Aphelenchoides bicaudatus]